MPVRPRSAVADLIRANRSAIRAVQPSPLEIAAARPGDEIVPQADVVMDRAFTLDQPPEKVWPWFVQLGKGRAGWYLPERIERLLPQSRRAARSLEPELLDLTVGDVIPDWGGRQATFTVAEMQAPLTLVHRSRRGDTELSWAINLMPTGSAATRVHLRLRLGQVKRRRLAERAGGGFDLLTVAGLAAGLRDRLQYPGTGAGQTLAMDSPTPGTPYEDYALRHTSPLPKDLERVAEATRRQTEAPRMMSGLVEARLLAGLVRLSRAKRVLEVGTFTGLGALAMAAAMDPGGTVTTLERDPAHVDLARAHFDASPLGSRIQLLTGDALELLKGVDGPFDLVYVDAWKPDYPAYLELVLPLVAPHGVIAFDNAFHGGRALESGDPVGAFNDRVQADPRLTNALLSIGDGVLLVWPEPERT